MTVVTPSTQHLDRESALEVLGLILKSRALEEGAIRWQRQGLIPGYAPCLGQEAAQIRIGWSMGPQDRAFPTYREAGVALALGVDMPAYMATHQGLWHGGLYDSGSTRLAPFQAVVAGSCLHAVGWALGRRMDGEDSVAVAFLGDGASSQGDVHEAMNFAATMGAPVVFYVQNNGWAISTPTAKQVAGGFVSERAAGYGMSAYRADGNDVEAVITASRAALDEARESGRPVVVEVMTYRRGPHSTSDDPGRYRSLQQEYEQGAVDPVDVATQQALAAGVEQAEADRLAEEARAWVEDLREKTVSAPHRPGDEIFDFVFQEPTETLTAQKAAWQEETDRD